MAVYAALEAAGGLTPIVANARHIKAVPGRKTDVIDAEWIARLIRYALVRASFVPPRPIRDLRELTRYRRTLVEVAASERRRLLKLLESADMKLAEVLSAVFGVTGRDILRADRRHRHPGADGRTGQRARAQKDRPTDHGLGGAPGRTPALRVADATAPDRGHRTRPAYTRCIPHGTAVGARTCPASDVR